jgi:hypothetical protein
MDAAEHKYLMLGLYSSGTTRDVIASMRPGNEAPEDEKVARVLAPVAERQ